MFIDARLGLWQSEPYFTFGEVRLRMRRSPGNLRIACNHAGLTHFVRASSPRLAPGPSFLGGAAVHSRRGSAHHALYATLGRYLYRAGVLSLQKLRFKLFRLPGEITRPQNRPLLGLKDSQFIEKTAHQILVRIDRRAPLKL